MSEDSNYANILNNSIKSISGVGPKRAEALLRCGIRSVLDLINYFPYRHEDRREISTIDQIQDGQNGTVCTTVESVCARKTQSRKKLVTVSFSDASGCLDAIWFNQPWMAKTFKNGQKVLLSGKFQCAHLITIANPSFELLPDDFVADDYQGLLIPIYRLTDGINATAMRKIVKSALELGLDQIEEYFPDKVLHQYNLIPLNQAYAIIHAFNCPNDILDPLHLAKARRRLIVDEFFTITMGLLLKRKRSEKLPYHIKYSDKGLLVKPFIRNLPFKLTDAQIKVIKEIKNDLLKPFAMNRLLQGDVGSGKTVVAMISMLMAVESGYKAAIMVPTEVLAQQHFNVIQAAFKNLNVAIFLLTGKSSAAQRKIIKNALVADEPLVIVGTHALISSNIIFNKLALTIIDEQHKFGVVQRNQLRDQATQPDMLVMTATPIPRSLALTVYGDLTVSVLEGFPRGRKPIKTYVVKPEKLKKVFQFIRKQIDAGHQAYIVYPLIDDSDKMPLKAASSMYKKMCQYIFPDLQIDLLHGRLPQAEKQRIMSDFSAGRTDILVSTTVIEVGIDVPNATVMVIEEAQRFGLAQLHQLRGRIGRGPAASYCILVDNEVDDEDFSKRIESRQLELLDTNQNSRLLIMSKSNDGFLIAQEDLKIRGPGEFFGVVQTGLPKLNIADIIKNEDELQLARHLSDTLLTYRELLTNESREKIRKRIIRTFGPSISAIDAG